MWFFNYMFSFYKQSKFQKQAGIHNVHDTHYVIFVKQFQLCLSPIKTIKHFDFWLRQQKFMTFYADVNNLKKKLFYISLKWLHYL